MSMSSLTGQAIKHYFIVDYTNLLKYYKTSLWMDWFLGVGAIDLGSISYNLNTIFGTLNANAFFGILNALFFSI